MSSDCRVLAAERMERCSSSSVSEGGRVAVMGVWRRTTGLVSLSSRSRMEDIQFLALGEVSTIAAQGSWAWQEVNYRWLSIAQRSSVFPKKSRFPSPGMIESGKGPYWTGMSLGVGMTE